MPLNTHILHDFDESWQKQLQNAVTNGIEVTVGRAIPEPADYHILIAGRPEEEHLKASPNLSAVVIPWAGLPVKTRELMLRYPQIAVHNLHHNAAPTAEIAFALFMAAAKNLLPTDARFRKNDWSVRYAESTELLLEGRTSVILGYGAVGERIGRACRAFGMEVIGLTRTRRDSHREGVSVDRVERLEEYLPRADALFLSLPHTPESDRILNQERLQMLPENAVVVNVARGAIVDEEAFYDELRSGRIRAGLDVWYQYPDSSGLPREDTPPSRFPFNNLDNVVMTPHLAGNCDRTEELRIKHLAALLNKAERAEPLPNRVDLKAGY